MDISSLEVSKQRLDDHLSGIWEKEFLNMYKLDLEGPSSFENLSSCDSALNFHCIGLWGL